MVVRATPDTKIKYHVPHPGSPVEELKVAFCLTGASRSLPTVPVLRGFKKNVLQSRRYVAAAFAALSLNPTVPGVHDSNLTLANKLSNVLYVRRAMQRLQPELKSWVTVNASEAIAQYGQRSCPAGGGLQPTTPMAVMWLTSLYAMQRCYDLVRGYELGRFDNFAFDYVARVRPDQLYSQPFPLAINVSVAEWPDDRVLRPAGQEGVALMPQGPVAAVYFRSFTSAGSCSLVAPSTPSLGQAVGLLGVPLRSNTELFPPAQQCWRPELEAQLGPCLLGATLRLHHVPVNSAAANPGPIAWMCNYDPETAAPAQPFSPMPPAVHCVTYKDVLKRPRPQDLVESALEEGAAAAAMAQDPLLALLLLLAALAALCHRTLLAEQAELARARAAALVRWLVSRAGGVLLGGGAEGGAELSAEEAVRRCVAQGEAAVQAAWAAPSARKLRALAEEWGCKLDALTGQFYGGGAGGGDYGRVPSAEEAQAEAEGEEEGESAGASPAAAAGAAAASARRKGTPKGQGRR